MSDALGEFDGADGVQNELLRKEVATAAETEDAQDRAGYCRTLRGWCRKVERQIRSSVASAWSKS